MPSSQQPAAHDDLLEIAKTLIATARPEPYARRELQRRGLPPDSVDEILATARQQIADFQQRETGQTLIRLAQTRIAQRHSKQQIIDSFIKAGMPRQTAYQTHALADSSMDDFWSTPEAAPLIPAVVARHTSRMTRGFYIIAAGAALLLYGIFLGTIDGTMVFFCLLTFAFGGIEAFTGYHARRKFQSYTDS